MKAKKEYLVLAAVILAAGFYLFFHKGDRTRYELPHLSKISINDITRLEISGGGETVRLSKKEDRWLIAPQNYPADGAVVKGMLFEIEDIAITDLVSESKAYARYQLDDEKRISVKAWEKETLQREMAIGKEAATYQHTFVRLPGNPNVYHARGDFRRKFEKSAADLRDREILAFDPDALKSIRIRSGQETLELNRQPVPPKADKTNAETAAKPTTAAEKTAWQMADGRSADSAALDSLLNTINNMRCEKYLEGHQKADFKNPVFEIILDGKQVLTLSIFEKLAEKDNEVPAISSFNAYPFTLSGDRLDSLRKTADKLAGKKAETPPKK